MAINFPDSPTNGQTYTDSGTGQTWTYELATNSWTASSLAVTGGVVYKGSVNITAAPPTGAKAGEQWSVGTGGTANAGYGPGVTGTITKGSMVMYTGAGWLEVSHSIPDATTLAKGIDTLKWNRTGTVLSPANAGDVVNISAGTAALPGLTPVGDANSGLFSPGPDQVAVSTGGSERLRIDSSGRLLVGAASDVGGGDFIQGDTSIASFRASTTANSSPFIKLLRSRGSTFSLSNAVLANDSVGHILFQAVDGSSLISAAQIEAEVDGTPGANDMPGRLIFSTTADGANTPTERMRITRDGAVLVGTTTFMSATTTTNAGCQLSPYGLNSSRSNQPCLQLQRTGSDGPIAQFYRQNTMVGSISVTPTATAYLTSSDYRLKENVTPVTDGITRLQQLKPSRFNFIAEPGKTVDGFIAHEAQTVVPECVTGTKDAVDGDGKPEYQGIDQSKMVPLLTAALQEAIGEIESLKARVAALETP